MLSAINGMYLNVESSETEEIVRQAVQVQESTGGVGMTSPNAPDPPVIPPPPPDPEPVRDPEPVLNVQDGEEANSPGSGMYQAKDPGNGSGFQIAGFNGYLVLVLIGIIIVALTFKKGGQ